MTKIPKQQTTWSALDFLENNEQETNAQKAELERRAELRRKLAAEQAKKESSITTTNDKQDQEIQARKEKARKEVQNITNYEKEQQRILSQNRPLMSGQLSGTQDFIGYMLPGYSTLMFADDASKHSQLVGNAIKNRQWGAAIGNAIKVPADIAMGAVSLIPFAGGIEKAVTSLPDGFLGLREAVEKGFNSKITYSPGIRYKMSDEELVSNIASKWRSTPYEDPQIPTALEYLKRQDYIAPIRLKFIEEHPIDETLLRRGFTMDDIKKAASREYAIRNQDSYKFLENQIKYESPWLKEGTFGTTERNAVGTHGQHGYSVDPGAEGMSRPIHLRFAADDTSPLALITKNHEVLHGSGSDEVGEYIYQYLTQNGIINPEGMNTYYKSASEVATHFSEFFDFLGFKAGKNGALIGPNGKTTVNEKDIESFLQWMGQPQQTSKGLIVPGGNKRGMFANIIDKKSFVKFCNEFLGSLATPVVVGTGIAISDNKSGGKLNYLNYINS